MITMNVYAKENTAPVIVEAEAVAGLQKLARIFCGDIEKTSAGVHRRLAGKCVRPHLGGDV